MGIARLLAKGWIVFCLFAGAHELHLSLLQGLPLETSLPAIATNPTTIASEPAQKHVNKNVLFALHFHARNTYEK